MVRLEPLEHRHAADPARAAEDRDTHAYTRVPGEEGRLRDSPLRSATAGEWPERRRRLEEGAAASPAGTA
ncbi:hypothetical protein [Streptomyces sp.]|uniref:hypothetical protein n=1 Tax=Streptomyces sp. TaxID=1931 RepID=UPI0028124A66|nr:hypothetical protein [Streptomyces sp.]